MKSTSPTPHHTGNPGTALGSRSEMASRAEVIAITERIRDNLEQAARSFWDIGNDLARVRRERLYERLSYPTFNDYIASELRVRIRQVQKLLAVAHMFARDDAVAIGGIERGTALIAYCRLLPDKPDPGELVRTDAAVDGQPLSACTAEDIVAATRRLRAAQAVKKAKTPKALESAREAKSVIQTVRSFVRQADLGRAKVSVRRNEVILRFSSTAFLARIARWGDGR